MISKLTNNQTNSEAISRSKAETAKDMAKKIETVFLTELLKVMFSETTFNKDRTTSTYMTIIIPEVAKMMAERDMGIGEFLTNNSQHFTDEGKPEGLKTNLLNRTSRDLKLPIENYFLDYFVILTLSRSPELMRRGSEGEESHPFFHLRDFSIRDSSGRLAPQNDGMGSRQLFSIGNLRREQNIELNSVVSDDNNISLPVSGRISSFYGLRVDPIDGTLKKHNGIDIAVSSGTKVRAVSSGKVVYSGYAKGYGNCVIIDHGNGFQTLYAHNSKNLVKTGQEVSQNTVIALSGSTGRVTGPHLHFEVRKDGKPVDPIAMINKSEKSPIL